MHRRSFFIFSCVLLTSLAFSQGKITSPLEQFGHEIGADYQLPNYQKLSEYWRRLDQQSDRMILRTIGKTEEGRDQYMAIVSSPKNLRELEKYRKISEKLARAENLTAEEARKLADSGKAVVWIDGGLHATETLCAQALMEQVYRLLSRDDAETRRILDNVIVLFVHANPDGMDLVSDWYMQNPDPTKRTMNIPRLYQKYIGHDNNRDFYAATQMETINMNRVMYREWYPQIMYNHHQTGPAGTVMFAPPFRDPFNHHIDPQVMSGIELVGSAMQNRFVAENKPGVTMRTGASYSTWWNGGLRTTAYYHNIIGILTETIGSPTPMRIPFVANRLEPKGNMLFPIEPQEWKFRQSIEYSITANMAILDLAAKNRAEFLFGVYSMASRQIALGNKDSWVDYPSRTSAARSLADLRQPELRAPRGYILPSDQPDFETVAAFVNALIRNGVRVHKATSDFSVMGKSYPAGSLVVLTAQAYRPHILDMFEPQDHPNDIPAPGAPPIAPYDNAGYTLAYTMGVQFDRILEGFSGPFQELKDEFVFSQTDLSNTNNGTYRKIFEALKSGAKIVKTKSGFVQDSTSTGTPVRLPKIALWDRYGGSMESGWTRWIMDQFGIPYTVVYPQEFQTGDLSRFDVLVFVNGAIPQNLREETPINRDIVPEKYHFMLGSMNQQALPNLKKFLESGGSIITIGGSTSLGKHLGLPVESHLVENGRPLPREKYFVPGSVLNIKLDPSQPTAWGYDERLDVLFDESPVLKITGPGVNKVAWFDSENPLRSGWAWGAKYLMNGVTIADAEIGKGKLYMFTPEILYRGQSRGAFRLYFNALLDSTTRK